MDQSDTCVFISYSRADTAFVERFVAALRAAGQDVWLDTSGIAPTADWMDEIRRAMDVSEAVVFVLSPHSLASSVCGEELGHATSAGKRVIPVLCADVDADAVPESLARKNWIVAAKDGDFDAAAAEVVRAMAIDFEWMREHTRVFIRAREWDSLGRSSSYVLRGDDLERAETWLAQAAGKEPAATELQTTFVEASVRHRRGRRRLTVAISGLVLAALAGLAVKLSMTVTEREAAARHGSALSFAEESEAIPLETPADVLRAAQRAVASMDEEFTAKGFRAWVRAFDRLPSDVETLLDCPDSAEIVGLSPDGTLAAVAREGRIVLHDLESTESPRELPESVYGRRLFISPGNRYGVGVSGTIVDLASGAVVGEMGELDENPSDTLSWARDERRVAFLRGYAAPPLLADAPAWEPRQVAPDADEPACRSVAVSPDGRWLLCGRRLFDLASDDAIREIAETEWLCTAWSPDGRVGAAVGEGPVRLLDLVESGAVEDRELPSSDAMGPLRFDAAGTRLAKSSIDTSVIWRMPNGSPGATVPEGAPFGELLAFPTGRLVIATPRRVRAWRVDVGGAAAVLRHSGATAVAVSADDRWIAAAGGGRVSVWDAGSLELVVDEALAGEAVCVAFRPGRRHEQLAVVTDREVCFVGAGTGVITRLPGAGAPLQAIWTGDGELLLTKQGTVTRVWSVDPPRILLEESIVGELGHVAVSDDRELVVLNATEVTDFEERAHGDPPTWGLRYVVATDGAARVAVVGELLETTGVSNSAYGPIAPADMTVGADEVAPEVSRLLQRSASWTTQIPVPSPPTWKSAVHGPTGWRAEMSEGDVTLTEKGATESFATLPYAAADLAFANGDRRLLLADAEGVRVWTFDVEELREIGHRRVALFEAALGEQR